jgi:hypothetical protein
MQVGAGLERSFSDREIIPRLSVRVSAKSRAGGLLVSMCAAWCCFWSSAVLAESGAPSKDPSAVAASLERLGGSLFGGSRDQGASEDGPSRSEEFGGEIKEAPVISTEVAPDQLAPPAPIDHAVDSSVAGSRGVPSGVGLSRSGATKSGPVESGAVATDLTGTTSAQTAPVSVEGNSSARKSALAPELEKIAFETRFDQARDAANAGNFTKARKIWELLSELGHADSQFSLGRMYARGDGVKQDFSKAKGYFEQAAAQNHGRALYSLGVMARNGDGQLVNQEKAVELFERAIAAGYDDARPALRELRR